MANGRKRQCWSDPIWPAWLQAVLALIALISGLPALHKISENSNAILTNERALRMQIFQPKNGEIVNEHTISSGYSAYPNRNNYLMITDAVGGVHYLQHGNILVDSAGFWFQPAAIGDVNSCGIEFLLTELATSETITAPTLGHLPDDAVITPSIKVAREPCKP